MHALRDKAFALQCVAEALAPTPELMQQVLADPDLLSGYDDAKVMAAVADIAAHPQHAARHMADPKVSHDCKRHAVLLNGTHVHDWLSLLTGPCSVTVGVSRAAHLWAGGSILPQHAAVCGAATPAVQQLTTAAPLACTTKPKT